MSKRKDNGENEIKREEQAEPLDGEQTAKEEGAFSDGSDGDSPAQGASNDTGESIETYRQRALEAERKYRALSDMKELSAEFEALSDMVSTSALPESAQYERLRDMGFSAREAFLATNSELILKAPSKSHLKSVVSRRAGDGGSISDEEYAVIRAVFGDTLSDERISELYKRVNKAHR